VSALQDSCAQGGAGVGWFCGCWAAPHSKWHSGRVLKPAKRPRVMHQRCGGRAVG
jgi:hypothetical protein